MYVWLCIGSNIPLLKPYLQLMLVRIQHKITRDQVKQLVIAGAAIHV